jgi:hypothetical protein
METATLALLESEIRRWIDPPHFAQEFERAQKERLPGTAEWLLGEDKIVAWLNHEDHGPSTEKMKKFDKRTVWLQGELGTVYDGRLSEPL